MQHQQPPIVFEYEDIRRIGLGAVHRVASGRRDVFEARDPCRYSLNFYGHFGYINAHERRIFKDLFPTCADVLPTRESVPIGMDTDGAGVGCPHLVHQIDIEAFEREIELEVGLNDLFRIGHKE